MSFVTCVKRTPRRLSSFLREERGTVLSEFVIVFPILVWAWIGMYYYWDVYRAVNLAQKASFTISDNLSRSSGEVTTAYIDGLEEFLTFLADTEDEVQIRVSSIRWNKANEEHEVAWSYSPHNGFPLLTNGNLSEIVDQIPTLVEYETVLIIETNVDYEPPLGITQIGNLDLGVGPQTFTEFIVTRPRFVTKVCLAGIPCT